MSDPVPPGLISERSSVTSLLWRFEVNRKSFDDPRLEWRRLFAEVLGTFFLVVVAAGAGVVDAVSPGSVSRVAAVVAPGIMVMAIILFMGAVAGAHLNPVVSIAFAARGDFPWRRVPGTSYPSCSGPRWLVVSSGSFLAGSRCWEPPNPVRGSRTSRRSPSNSC